MKRIAVVWILILLFFLGCNEHEKSGTEEINLNNQREEYAANQREEYAAKTMKNALNQAKNNNPAGLLKLFEIANDDLTYGVYRSEGALEALSYFLYSKSELWIKTFAQIDLEKFKSTFTTISDTDPPEDGSPDKRVVETIYKNMKKIKGNKNEMALANYILGLCSKYQRK
jgi:hypothetical protein